eukprot:8905694-Heterocapsa_arctica.AAC.1
MLEHCKDHVMLIQEHWRLKEEIEKWKTTAFVKGWQGVWEPAKVTENIKMASLADLEEWPSSRGMGDSF